MIRPGLVSVTFRKLSCEEIIDLVGRAGLDAIEWGGDIHVPHGDLTRAGEVARLMHDAGLVNCSYGSYYRVGHAEPAPFEIVLETAVALGAPNVRVWAGKQGSEASDEDYRRKVADDARRICELAAGADATVSFEYHGNSLTDRAESAAALLDSVGAGNLRTYWQPLVGVETGDGLASLRTVRPWLSNFHVYHWSGTERRPLSEGADRWRQFFAEGVADAPDAERFALMEFVRGDSPEAFVEDAAALKRIIATL